MPQGETSLYQLPQNEITFSNNVFSIKKCNPIGVDTPDIQCNDATVPHEKNFNLVFRVSLNDANIGTLNEIY